MADDQCIRTSLIIVSRNEGHYLKQTVDFIKASQVTIPYELIVVDDGSSDRSTAFVSQEAYRDLRLITTTGIGPGPARNLGVKAAQGNLLVFLDAHIIVNNRWLDQLLSHFTDPEVCAVAPVLGGFNPTHPDVYGFTLDKNLKPVWVTKPIVEFSPVALAGVGCLALRRDIFEKLGGFDEAMKGIGYDDLDLCLRLWTYGYNVYLDPAVRVLHFFRRQKPYPVAGRDVIYNFLRVCFRHYNGSRLATAIRTVQNSADLGEILAELLMSDIWDERKAIQSQRRYDDNWFFSRFLIKV